MLGPGWALVRSRMSGSGKKVSKLWHVLLFLEKEKGKDEGRSEEKRLFGRRQGPLQLNEQEQWQVNRICWSLC